MLVKCQWRDSSQLEIRMKILPILPLQGPHGRITEGPKRGHDIFYRDALFSTLVELKPKVCLEIGTNDGSSAGVFQNYFEQFGSDDSLLITADVKIYSEIDHPNVKQVQVHPHVNNIKDLHHIEDLDLIDGKVDRLMSVQKNISIIKKVMQESGVSQFDFAFIDGDHQRESLIKDIEIVEALIKEPGYILVDDIHDYIHECAEYFHEEMKPKYSHYLFEEWDTIASLYDDVVHDSTGLKCRVKLNGTAGVALIWQR